MKENDGDAGKVPIKCIKSKMAQIQRYSNTIISLGSCTILVIRPVADKTLKTIVSTSLNLNQPARDAKSCRCCRYICAIFFQLVLIFGPFWVIFGPFWQFWVIFGPIWAILGHFWAILGNFRSFLGHFLC